MPVHEHFKRGSITIDGSHHEDLVIDEPQSIGRVVLVFGDAVTPPSLRTFL